MAIDQHGRDLQHQEFLTLESACSNPPQGGCFAASNSPCALFSNARSHTAYRGRDRSREKLLDDPRQLLCTHPQSHVSVVEDVELRVRDQWPTAIRVCRSELLGERTTPAETQYIDLLVAQQMVRVSDCGLVGSDGIHQPFSLNSTRRELNMSRLEHIGARCRYSRLVLLVAQLLWCCLSLTGALA